MDEELNENLKKLGTWKRIFFMLVFAAIGGVVRMVLWAVIFLQIVSVLITGKVNIHVLGFGRSLSVYTYHILLFLSFNTDVLPFPFAAWNLTADLCVPETSKK